MRRWGIIFSVIGSYWHYTYGCRMSFCCPWGCGSTHPHSYTPLTSGHWCSCWQGRDNRACSLAAIYRSQVYILKKKKGILSLVKYLSNIDTINKFNSLFVNEQKIYQKILNVFLQFWHLWLVPVQILNRSIKPLDYMSLWLAHSNIHA